MIEFSYVMINFHIESKSFFPKLSKFTIALGSDKLSLSVNINLGTRGKFWIRVKFYFFEIFSQKAKLLGLISSKITNESASFFTENNLRD